MMNSKGQFHHRCFTEISLNGRKTGVRRSQRSEKTVGTKLTEDIVIDVRSAEYVEGYKVRLCFSDAQERIVDFGPFLQSSLNPMIRKYLNLDEFKCFSVEHGDLHWNDYDLCFPVADLYETIKYRSCTVRKILQHSKAQNTKKINNISWMIA